MYLKGQGGVGSFFQYHLALIILDLFNLNIYV